MRYKNDTGILKNRCVQHGFTQTSSAYKDLKAKFRNMLPWTKGVHHHPKARAQPAHSFYNLSTEITL